MANLKQHSRDSYWEALESQIELWQFWRSELGRTTAKRFWLTMMAMLGEEGSATADCYWRDQIHVIESADPYYISSAICELLDSSLDSLPELTLDDVRVPTPAGWVYYALPQRVAELPKSLSHIVGFTWFRDETAPNALELIFYTRDIDTGKLIPLTRRSWLAGHTWREKPRLQDLGPLEPHRQEIESSHVNMCRCAAAFLAFIAQPLAVTQRIEVSRSTRKRLQHTGLTLEPLVKVITLRRREYSTRPGSRPVDWSCRWVVRPHWRNQYYPSRKAHKPKLIPSYIKGPEDKPLKKPSISLFAVVR